MTSISDDILFEEVIAPPRTNCSGQNCKKDLNYFNENEQVFPYPSYFKQTSKVIRVHITNWANALTHYYCFDCAEQLFFKIKKVLDPNLKVFR